MATEVLGLAKKTIFRLVLPTYNLTANVHACFTSITFRHHCPSALKIFRLQYSFHEPANPSIPFPRLPSSLEGHRRRNIPLDQCFP